MSNVPEHHPFVERFAAGWRSHDAERLGALLHPEVILRQPLMPVLHGRSAAVRALGRFLQMFPDLQISIHDSVARGNVLFIEFSFAGSLGKRRVEWHLVDRIELADGLARSRVAYFDPWPLIRAVLLQPWMWFALLARRWRRRPVMGTRNNADHIPTP